ncbi:glycosyltransferase, partial [Candidatus Pelagibacter bacterium]|nr:glycosyltransferase [Candidatus Pelagibacter bacterium]
EDAFYSNAYIVELPYIFAIFFSKILDFFFDAIVIDYKFDKFRKSTSTELGLNEISKKFKIKKVLIDSNDSGKLIIKKEISDKFDYVIKREKYKSLIDKKYISSMLPCTLVDYRLSKKDEKIKWKNIGKSKPNDHYTHEVFFGGLQTSKKRFEIIEYLKKNKVNILTNKMNLKIPYNLYLRNIYDSAINLAIPGHGEFTYRHLEILACCSFMVCEKSINEIELPLPLRENEHFITYDCRDDLLEKIKFYLDRKDLRSKIALNGRLVLEENYSPKNHGEKIIKTIF